MVISKISPLKGNCMVWNSSELDSLDGWRVICFVPFSSSSSTIKLSSFFNDPFNDVLCGFIATVSNTVLEEKKILSGNNFPFFFSDLQKLILILIVVLHEQLHIV